MFKKGPHGCKETRRVILQQTYAHLCQLEPPFHVDPLPTALSISISNEPQKL